MKTSRTILITLICFILSSSILKADSNEHTFKLFTNSDLQRVLDQVKDTDVNAYATKAFDMKFDYGPREDRNYIFIVTMYVGDDTTQERDLFKTRRAFAKLYNQLKTQYMPNNLFLKVLYFNNTGYSGTVNTLTRAPGSNNEKRNNINNNVLGIFTNILRNVENEYYLNFNTPPIKVVIMLDHLYDYGKEKQVKFFGMEPHSFQKAINSFSNFTFIPLSCHFAGVESLSVVKSADIIITSPGSIDYPSLLIARRIEKIAEQKMLPNEISKYFTEQYVNTGTSADLLSNVFENNPNTENTSTMHYAIAVNNKEFQYESVAAILFLAKQTTELIENGYITKNDLYEIADCDRYGNCGAFSADIGHIFRFAIARMGYSIKEKANRAMGAILSPITFCKEKNSPECSPQDNSIGIRIAIPVKKGGVIVPLSEYYLNGEYQKFPFAKNPIWINFINAIHNLAR